MTLTEARCAVCDFDGGELTCAPRRAARFALTFAVVMFATAYFLGAAVFHTDVAFTVATSVTTTAIVGVAVWRICAVVPAGLIRDGVSRDDQWPHGSICLGGRHRYATEEDCLWSRAPV